MNPHLQMSKTMRLDEIIQEHTKALSPDFQTQVLDFVLFLEQKQAQDALIKNHQQEKTFYEVGKRLFYQRGGTHDFSCASCHSSSGQRIRLQDLPDLTTQAGSALGWGSWPAYRVSSGEFWTMQRRLNDCFRQQRMPFPIYGSDVTIALSIFMANKGDGGTVQTPGLKR
ncbi:MAG: sulfur oxidation c-type cytochrome SoxA [Alcaligenaceae bacterium]